MAAGLSMLRSEHAGQKCCASVGQPPPVPRQQPLPARRSLLRSTRSVTYISLCFDGKSPLTPTLVDCASQPCRWRLVEGAQQLCSEPPPWVPSMLVWTETGLLHTDMALPLAGPWDRQDNGTMWGAECNGPVNLLQTGQAVSSTCALHGSLLHVDRCPASGGVVLCCAR